MTLQERFAAMFAAIDGEGRHYVMGVLQIEHDRVQAARRPALRLIQGGPQSAAERNQTSAVVRIKNKEA